MRKFILLFVIVMFSFGLFAQQECAYVLEEAQEMFDAGLIETTERDLSSAFK